MLRRAPRATLMALAGTADPRPRKQPSPRVGQLRTRLHRDRRLRRTHRGRIVNPITYERHTPAGSRQLPDVVMLVERRQTRPHGHPARRAPVSPNRSEDHRLEPSVTSSCSAAASPRARSLATQSSRHGLRPRRQTLPSPRLLPCRPVCCRFRPNPGRNHAGARSLR